MLTDEQKQRLLEIDKMIQSLQKEKETINPFANLKLLGNKAFGEEWSENYILSKCPNLIRCDEKGYDFLSKNFGRIEVKSSRLPCKSITFNQLHPDDCDYFLFVLYNTEEYDTELYLVSSNDLCDNFHLSVQHDRNSTSSCFSMKFMNTLKKYEISWTELRRAGGEFVE